MVPRRNFSFNLRSPRLLFSSWRGLWYPTTQSIILSTTYRGANHFVSSMRHHSLGGPKNLFESSSSNELEIGAGFLKAHKCTRQERCPTESNSTIFWLIWSPILTTIYLRQSRCSSLDWITIRISRWHFAGMQKSTVREFMDLLFYDDDD